MTRFLILADVVALGNRLLAVEDEHLVIRDVGLLESALARPRASVFGRDAYPELTTKAAALMESLARNHCLVDGNKRLAWAGTKLFLALNGVWLAAPSPDEGERFVLDVCQGALAVPEIAATLTAWSAPR